ncbi:MAG: glycosyltransferase family 4 protein [Gordonia sp. (in: high G+C Gram-positive bacteria)]
MTVALISPVDPYPTDAGKKVVLAGFLSYFVERYGRDHVHYIWPGSGRPSNDFPVDLRTVPLPSRVVALRNVAARSLTGRSSLQEALLYSSATQRAITEVRDRLQPTIEVYDTVRMAQYAGDNAPRQICYLDDLFSERYSAMLDAAARYPDVDIQPLGNFARHVPPALRPLAEHRRGQIALLRAERKLVRNSEDRVAKSFRRSILVNDREATVLTQRTGVPAAAVRAVPPLVDASDGPVRQVRDLEFVFLGLLSLPHNEDGLRWFLTSVWPLVLEQMPAARLRIVGRDVRAGLSSLAAQFADSVAVEGYVEDLSSVLSGAVALVNPLRFGSGVKLKVIDALARGIPVVSTTLGAEGIRSGRDAGILVGDQPKEIAELLCDLTSPRENQAVSDAAREHFRSVYSRDAVFAAYDAAFGV